jgi:peptide deformylase
MAILNIVTAPDPILKEKSLPVSEITPEIKRLMRNMLDTLYANYGVGLAAVQVGVHKQIMVLDLGDDEDEGRPKDFYPLYIINPEITWASDTMNVATEGCLSVPTIRLDVPRPERIKIKYMDFHGKESELETGGWLARAIQHEMDHMFGVVILDYLSSLKKDIAISKLKKFKKQML